MARNLYDLILYLVSLALPWAGRFHPRIGHWLQGRSDQLIPVPQADRRVVWMHCSSLGEFEQGRPVLEAIRRDHPELWIALTFFSPSGYDRQKHFKATDWVGYLPLDTPRQAKAFLEALQPSLVLWVKYDFWFNHLDEVRRRGIPSLLFAARFRNGSWLEKLWAKSFRNVILSFGRIAVQDPSSAAWVHRWGHREAVIAGDPRVDRVMALPAEPLEDEVLKRFAGKDPVVVCGSVWEEDIGLLAEAMKLPELAAWRWLLAPHDISDPRIKGMERMIGLPSVRYSDAGRDAGSSRIMFLDTIGMLNRVYRLGRMAYVGGGHGKSVHNLLEPAVYGIPVIFGPRHGKFPEGVGLIAAGGGFEVRDAKALVACLLNLRQEESLASAGQKARQFIESHAGATRTIMAMVKEMLTT